MATFMPMRTLLIVLLVGPMLRQVVQIGPNDPHHCLKIESILPNLELRDEAHIVGIVQDQTTAPFENSRVELRRYISQRNQVRVRAVLTDDRGRFDLGFVKAGKYRLLASPDRRFKQPSTLECKESHDCELKITLVGNPTDQLTSSCPIR